MRFAWEPVRGLQPREFVARASPRTSPSSKGTRVGVIPRGQHGLLGSFPHVAVDNVLERLVGRFPQVEVVRIGKAPRSPSRGWIVKFPQRCHYSKAFELAPKSGRFLRGC